MALTSDFLTTIVVAAMVRSEVKRVFELTLADAPVGNAVTDFQ